MGVLYCVGFSPAAQSRCSPRRSGRMCTTIGSFPYINAKSRNQLLTRIYASAAQGYKYC